MRRWVVVGAVLATVLGTVLVYWLAKLDSDEVVHREVADPKIVVPAQRLLRHHLTHATPTRDPWADCNLVPDDPPSTGSTEMAGLASDHDEFFEGSAESTDDFVPSGARQLAICSVAAQSDDFWILSGELIVARVAEVLNAAPEEVEGFCPADYGPPTRLVLRYEGGGALPLVVSHSGCGYVWNGQEERTGIREMVNNLLEATSKESLRRSR